MSTPEERLAALGLSVPHPAAPVAAYVPAVRTGTLVWTSGQLPMVDGKLAATGKVGAEVTPERAKELAQICALNAIAAVKAEVGDLGPGEVRVLRNSVWVGTATHAVLLGEVRAQGKKQMAAGDWARGVRVEPGERLG